MAVGMITDIERCSFRDGPGIRTVVFFKGCNMHCKWCHNPETISPRKSMMYYPQRCISCFKCVYACPARRKSALTASTASSPGCASSAGSAPPSATPRRWSPPAGA